jgi:hypothetical protein
VTCHNGIALESGIDPIVNAMPNKKPHSFGALLKLPWAPKALLFQHIVVGRNNMVEARRLSQTFGFAPMTLSAT